MKDYHLEILKLINVYTALMEYNKTRDKSAFIAYSKIVKDLKILI